MEWNDKLQAIIDYVENHLQRKEEAINYDEIAQIAGCSFPFFQKVFAYMNKISFSDYVRYRKLTLAGYDVKSTNLKIVDISYKYGYDSPTSFTKAFQHFHGVSPSEAKNNDVGLAIMPKMQISYRQSYAWRIETKDSMRFIGVSKKLTCQTGYYQEAILAFWSECRKNNIFATLISMDTANPQGMFGFVTRFDQQTNEMEYAIMVCSDKPLLPNFSELILPQQTWAVFDCKGSIPHVIQKGWKYLNEEWLVKYPFEHAPYPDLEWYSNGNQYSNEYVSQIWIPILQEE